MAKNELSLDTVCASLAYAMGIDAPEKAAAPSESICKYIDEKLCGKRADRIFMYNPDAIAQWVYGKYSHFFGDFEKYVDLDVPLCTVMPSVTPVCFGTMYTGAQPSVHGIQAYKKPVIKIDTLFDALIRAGKKPAIVADNECSMGKIYLERDMDYYICDSTDETNAVAAGLILSDEYDFIAVYNGNYDEIMHKYGPESREALGELRANIRTFNMFSEMIEKHWKTHDTLVGFAMDHGCHEIDGGSGAHGLDMDEDINIVHSYKIYPREKSV